MLVRLNGSLLPFIANHTTWPNWQVFASCGIIMRFLEEINTTFISYLEIRDSTRIYLIQMFKAKFLFKKSTKRNNDFEKISSFYWKLKQFFFVVSKD